MSVEPEEILNRLHTLSFFALCPNGKRISVQEICREFEREPEGLAYRTFDNRLVLVIQAMFPDETTPYWQQVFYYSTGTSSGMAKTWAPFNGIFLQMIPEGDEGDQPNIIRRNGRTGGEALVIPWFEKSEFSHNPPPPRLPPFSPPTPEALVAKNYTLFLPEGNYAYKGSGFGESMKGKGIFARFGAPSYILASHALGGAYFIDAAQFEETDQAEELLAVDTFRLRISRSSPNQACFDEMMRTYPITKPNIVNDYIDKHKATSLCNAFRSEGIFPLSLAEISVSVKNLPYPLPSQLYWLGQTREITQLFLRYKAGTATLEDVRVVLSNKASFLRTIMEKERKSFILHNEPAY